MSQKRQVHYYHYKVFSKSVFSGNSTGILINPQGLTKEAKQNIAKNLNLETTTFVNAKSDNKFDIDFFTPLREVAVRGHALLGTAIALIDNGKVISQSENEKEPETVRFYANGVKHLVKVNIKKNELNEAFIEFLQPVITKLNLEYDKIISSLRSQMSQILVPEEILIVNTGLNHFFIEFANLKDLKQIKPDFTSLKEICETFNIDSIGCFCKQPENDQNFLHLREFAPLLGNDEESASVTTVAGLLFYMENLKKLGNLDGKSTVHIEQGYEVNSPTDIPAEIIHTDNKIEKIKIKTTAICFVRGVLNL